MATWTWPASTIVRVVDGDTLDAAVVRDLGFGAKATFPVRLRLNRINAASLASARGKAAARRLEALVAGVAVEVTTVAPYKYGGPKDAAGEWMAEVVLPDGVNVSDLLVAEKLAAAWDGRGARPQDR